MDFGQLIGFSGDASKALGLVTGVGDLISGGAVSSWLNRAQQKRDFDEWKKKQEIMQGHQKDFLQFQNSENLLYNQALTKFNNEETKKLTKDMAYFNWENFTSPEAVMSAYKEAGINPAMVAGSISGVNPSQTISSASTQSGGSGAVAQASHNSRNSGKALELSNLLLQNDYTSEVVEAQKLANEHQALENDRLRKEQPFFEQNAEQQAESLVNGNRLSEKQVEEIQSRIKNNDADTIYKAALTNNVKIMDNKLAAEMEKLQADRDFIKASTEEKLKMLDKIDKDMELSDSVIALNYANADLARQLKSLNQNQTAILYEKWKQVKSATDVVRVKNELEKEFAPYNAWVDAILNPLQQTAEIIDDVTNIPKKLRPKTTTTTSSKYVNPYTGNSVTTTKSTTK